MTLPWKHAYSVNDAADEIGISRTKLLELVAAGKIRAKKIGKATIILGESLALYLAETPDADIKLPAAMRRYAEEGVPGQEGTGGQ